QQYCQNINKYYRTPAPMGFYFPKTFSITIIAALLLLPSLPNVANAAPGCTLKPTSTTTTQFLNELPSLDAKLKTCPVTLPGPLSRVSKSVQIIIAKQNGGVERVFAEINGGELTGLRKGTGAPSFIAVLGECELDTILASKDRLGATGHIWTQNKIRLSGVGFWNKVILFFARGAINTWMANIAQPVRIQCAGASLPETGRANGQVCDHGGQCASGNCIYTRGEGANRIYKCSCDPFTYKTTCPAKPTPLTDNAGLRPAGEVCDHGGQCQSGNCIYAGGEGANRIYKCSCDPFKLDTTSC
ncbi:hypothetical protein D6783_03185, partial [Candidatus Woesearchaeota archaeon]